MNLNENAEVLDHSYYFMSNIFLKSYFPEKKALISSIPRSSNSTPILFETNKFFHIILTNFEKIYFFKVIFMKIIQMDDQPCCYFKVVEERSMVNNRKEKRQNVNFQGVSTDDKKIHIIQVLDISASGIKIETPDNIEAEFVEIIFEDEGTKRVERGRVIWKKKSPNENLMLYGIEFQEKKPS
jgi:hypothetical protein